MIELSSVAVKSHLQDLFENRFLKTLNKVGQFSHKTLGIKVTLIQRK